ncbi:MAG: hypothetical protein HY236_04660 [Acidobacteria bacterium]|nr:hypothetical protein [Acidobacteriota bacterium]
MKPRVESNGRPSDARHQFMETGASTYLEALAAVGKFQREVWEACSSVFKERAKELGDALGQPVDAGEISIHQWPGQLLKFDGFYAILGAKVQLRQVATLYCYVWWGYEDSAEAFVRAVVAVYAEAAEVRKKLLSSFRAEAKSRIKDDSGEIYLQEPIPPDEFPNLQQKLNDLLTEWIGLWKKIGGLKLHLK